RVELLRRLVDEIDAALLGAFAQVEPVFPQRFALAEVLLAGLAVERPDGHELPDEQQRDEGLLDWLGHGLSPFIASRAATSAAPARRLSASRSACDRLPSPWGTVCTPGRPPAGPGACRNSSCRGRATAAPSCSTECSGYRPSPNRRRRR